MGTHSRPEKTWGSWQDGAKPGTLERTIHAGAEGERSEQQMVQSNELCKAVVTHQQPAG